MNSALGRTAVTQHEASVGVKWHLSITWIRDVPTVTSTARHHDTRAPDDVDPAHIDQLAHRYLGLDKNPYAKAGDMRDEVRNGRCFPFRGLDADSLRRQSADRGSARRALGCAGWR